MQRCYSTTPQSRSTFRKAYRRRGPGAPGTTDCAIPEAPLPKTACEEERLLQYKARAVSISCMQSQGNADFIGARSIAGRRRLRSRIWAGSNRMRASIREHFERGNADLTVDQDESVSLGGAGEGGVKAPVTARSRVRPRRLVIAVAGYAGGCSVQKETPQARSTRNPHRLSLRQRRHPSSALAFVAPWNAGCAPGAAVHSEEQSSLSDRGAVQASQASDRGCVDDSGERRLRRSRRLTAIYHGDRRRFVSVEPATTRTLLADSRCARSSARCRRA
jgi:hypothetical protein